MKDPFSHSLSIDLSGPKGTLAIHQIDASQKMRLLESAVITQDGNHSERLIPQVKESLLQAGITLSQINFFVTSSGPGSFTGLRVGLASVKALAYSQNKPIEVLSGSEARAISWVGEQKLKLESDELIVLTYLTIDRFVCSHFRITDSKECFLVSETVTSNFSFLVSEKIQCVLIDDRIQPEVIPTDKTTSIFKHPLEAHHLMESLHLSKTRKTYSTTPEWINLVPTYFGSDRF